MAHHLVFNCSKSNYDGDCKEIVKRLVFIELNMVLVVLGAVALVVFGSCRRYCSNVVFDKIQWMNYLLVTNVLFTLTIGQMVGAPFPNVLFAVWGAILLNTAGGADSFSSYSPADNEQWKSVTAQALFRSILVSTLLGYALTTKYGKTVLVISFLLSAKRIDERAVALKMATKSSLAQTTKYIADFMAGEHDILVDGELDPTQMKGYNYLVSGDTDKWTASPPSYDHQLNVKAPQVVTLQKIWQCNGSLLRGERGQRFKDICLSFALFRLLCRRFGGHPFLESSQNKTWRLVRYGLLSKEGDYKRAFRVIEVELNFLFDLFYTKYAVIFKDGQGLQKLKIFNAILLLSGCYVMGLLILNLDTDRSYKEVTLVTANNDISVDKVVTYIILVSIFLMEIAQLLLLLLSNWATMLWICNYVRRISLPHNKDTYLMFWPKIIMFCQEQFKPWERKLGQYSLLKSFNRNPWRLKFECLLMFLFSGIIDIPRAGQKGKYRIKLTEEVKEAVMISLRRNDQPRKLSNGEESLRRNGVWNNQQLSSACTLETPTHVILVWHVATSLCMFDELMRSPAKSIKDPSSDHFKIASTLSGYCSYLVAFAPRLICVNPIVCELIFDKVIKEARQILKDCNSESEMCEKIKSSGEEETIIYKGAMLAEELLLLPNIGKDKWKVLADFWTELILFLAPSGDPMAHVEHLAKGGEFVTHLWALLSHAGILNQCPTLGDV